MDARLAWLWISLTLLAISSAAQPRPGFGADELAVDAVAGRIELSARRGEVWRLDVGPNDTGLAPTDRVVLSGDVSLRVGTSVFAARQAVVWMQRRGSSVQVLVYAEDVDTPAGDPASSLTARELTVAARVELADANGVVAEPALTLDSLVRAKGDSAFAYRAEAAFDRVLGRRRPVGPLSYDATQRLGPEPDDEPTGPTAAIFPAKGQFTLAAKQMSYRPGTAASARLGAGDAPAIIIGAGDAEAVAVEYRADDGRRSLTLTAKRAVVFLADPDRPGYDGGSLEAGEVDGVYLEGGVVASDGALTLRGERVYYSVREDRALILDAVLSQYNRQLRTPLFIRADAIRQESPTLFRAEGARVSNTGFARPHLSVGASSVTVRPKRGPDWSEGLFVDARNLTLRAADVPFIWFPFYRGDPSRFPLRTISYGLSNRFGGSIQTRWDALALLGIDPGFDLDVELGFDIQEQRGDGIEVVSEWRTSKGDGNFLLGLRLDDQPEEVVLAAGRSDPITTGDRGLLLADYRARLTDKWSIFLEAAETSDPTFAVEFYPRETRERREFRTGGTLVRRDGNEQTTFEASGTVDPYPVNQFLITGDATQTERLPEVRYARFADNILPELPGALTLTTDASLGVLRLRPAEATPNELGVPQARRSRLIFGLEPDELIADQQRADGLPVDEVTRFDLRQELTAAVDAGPIELTPFAVGRVTAYDSNFSGISPDETDNARLFGAVGATASTEVQRVYEGIRSDVLDLHRLRHIITPSATVWTSRSSIESSDLPVYDDAVESISEGLGYRLALSQRFQTQRGGPGRWESVDVLTVNAEYVDSTDEADRESTIGRWYDARPESSNLHEYGAVEATWNASEAVAVVAGVNYDFELDQPAFTHIGGEIDHAGVASTRVSMRSFTETDVLVLTGQNRYDLTEKYSTLASASYNSAQGTLQVASLSVLRRFQAGELGIILTADNIRDENSFGFVVRPLGTGRGSRFRGIGAEQGQRGGSALGG
ncbi:MAG: hypothetical protein AAF108_10215 [Planctomycetota bacterium]